MLRLNVQGLCGECELDAEAFGEAHDVEQQAVAFAQLGGPFGGSDEAVEHDVER